MPLLRRLHDEGKLSGPPLALMAARVPDEELCDTKADPHEIDNLVKSDKLEHWGTMAPSGMNLT